MSRSFIASVGGLVRRIRGAVGRGKRYPVLYNVNSAHEARSCKRALVVYRVRSFLLPGDAPEFRRHQNLKQCKQIAAILGELN